MAAVERVKYLFLQTKGYILIMSAIRVVISRPISHTLIDHFKLHFSYNEHAIT